MRILTFDVVLTKLRGPVEGAGGRVLPTTSSIGPPTFRSGRIIDALARMSWRVSLTVRLSAVGGARTVSAYAGGSNSRDGPREPETSIVEVK